MSKKAIIVLATGFEETEAVTTIDILRRAGIDLTVAGLDDIKISSPRKLTITTDKKLDEAGFDFDACIFPGGMQCVEHLAKSEKIKNLIQKMIQGNKIIAAICAAPAIVLAPTNVLKNKTATCYPGLETHFGKDTRYKNEKVVVDGNIITSQGVGTSLDFAFSIVENLLGKEIANKIRKDTLVN